MQLMQISFVVLVAAMQVNWRLIRLSERTLDCKAVRATSIESLAAGAGMAVAPARRAARTRVIVLSCMFLACVSGNGRLLRSGWIYLVGLLIAW